MKTQQSQMLGRAYSVRNSLVELVGEQKLSEDSPVYQYYYNRINDLLCQQPDVIGLEDILKAIISADPEHFDRAMKESRKEVNELAKRDEFNSEEILNVVENFYQATINVILAHSSVLNVMFIFTNILSKYIAYSLLVRAGKLLEKIAETNVYALKTIFLFQEESRSLSKGSFNLNRNEITAR